MDYFEKLSLFSAGISRLSSFIKRLGGETDSARSGINHTASPANAQSCVPGLHSAYLFSTSVIRTFVTRFGMSKKSIDSEYSKVWYFVFRIFTYFFFLQSCVRHLCCGKLPCFPLQLLHLVSTSASWRYVCVRIKSSYFFFMSAVVRMKTYRTICTPLRPWYTATLSYLWREFWIYFEAVHKYFLLSLLIPLCNDMMRNFTHSL